MTDIEMQKAAFQAGIEAMRTEMVRCHQMWAMLLFGKAAEAGPGTERTITEHMAGWHAGQAAQIGRMRVSAPAAPRLAAVGGREVAA